MNSRVPSGTYVILKTMKRAIEGTTPFNPAPANRTINPQTSTEIAAAPVMQQRPTQFRLGALPSDLIALIILQCAPHGLDPSRPQGLIRVLRDLGRTDKALYQACQSLVSGVCDRAWKFQATALEWKIRDRADAHHMSLLASIAQHWQLDFAPGEDQLWKARQIQGFYNEETTDRRPDWARSHWPLVLGEASPYTEAEWRDTIALWPENVRSLKFAPDESVQSPEQKTIDVLKTCTALQTVEIALEEPPDAPDEVDLTWLEQLPALKHLRLDPQISLDKIPPKLRTKLDSLFLWDNHFPKDGYRFPEWVINLPELGLDLDTADTDRFPNGIPDLPQNLTSLVVRGPGPIQIPKSITKLRTYEWLGQDTPDNLRELEVVSRKADPMLIAKLGDPKCKLRSLTLDHLPGNSNHFTALCTAIKKIQTLQTLTLCDGAHGRTAEEFQQLVQLFTDHSSLEELTLKIDGKILVFYLDLFSPALRSCTKLHTLTLTLGVHSQKEATQQSREALTYLRDKLSPLIDLHVDSFFYRDPCFAQNS